MMGLLKWYLGYHAVKHLMKSAQPQPVNIQLNIQLPEEEEEPVITDREEDWTRPPIYDEKGREVDEDGFPVSPLERSYRELRPDPGPFSAGDGIYVRDDGVHPPRFFDPSGRETDKDGSPL